MTNTAEQTKAFARNKFAWPGGYPMCAITQDGGCLCHTCLKDNYRIIREAQRGCFDAPDWNVVCVDVNWESTTLQCDHCNEVIESAYGEENNDE
jgi:hypothetical protein